MTEKKELKKTRLLKERLVREQVRVWDQLSANEKKQVSAYGSEYLKFLNYARTERRAVRTFVAQAEKWGFQDIDLHAKPVDRIFRASKGKVLVLAVIGRKPLTEGIRLVTSHLDCPRLDLKPNPLYEDTGLALLKTHYYGGIKKYQWVARSLALCGMVIRADGSLVEIDVGLDPQDPVLTIPDLLPHLARRQMEQKASEFVPAENLNVILGCTPYEDKAVGERVKLATLELLHEKFRICEEDLTTAEIEVVPAEPAREAGLDRGMIAGYGQDDRVCAFAAFKAILDVRRPDHTAIAVFFDKEEVGSEGNTGAQSRFLENFLMDLLALTDGDSSAANLNRILANGKALSGDVTSALDPTYPEVFERRNAAQLGYGINITKYTGSGGKYAASEANAEYAAWVRKLFNDNKVIWQVGDGGRVDEGGGGTVAKYLAKMGMDIIDCGPPVLGMHSPMEVCSKEDVWMCHKAFGVFFAS